MAVSPLVPQAYELDPHELVRRIDSAPPRRVRRADLAGRIGLTDHELYGLGCTLARPGAKGIAGMVGWRLVVVAGALIVAIAVAAAVASSVVPLLGGLGDPTPLDNEPPEALAAAVLCLAAAAGGRWVLLRGVRTLRRLAARRRRAGASPSASRDRHARATVAVLREPGAIRVQLLWVRGAAGEPDDVEVRVLAERRVDEDDAGRAEDAIADLTDVAMLADKETHAFGLPRRAAHPPRLAAIAPPGRFDPDVDEAWAPEALTDAGAAELARRVTQAPVGDWSAEALAPAVIEEPRADEPRPWPRDRTATRPDRMKWLRYPRWAMWTAIAVFVVALGSDEPPTATETIVAVGAVAVAAGAVLLRRVVLARDPVLRLLRRTRDGRFVVARGRGRTELLHVRAKPDDSLDVRIVARIRSDNLEAARTLWVVADDAQARADSVDRSEHRLRALVARLGRVLASSSAPRLAREPLAWLAAVAIPLLVAASIKHTIAGTWFENGAGNRVLSYAWPLLAAVLLVHAARRIHDPHLQE